MFTIESGQLFGDPDFEIHRLEMLIADLKRIACGDSPSKEELADAPILYGYGLALRRRPCLAGYVKNHQILGSTAVLTSELWVIAEEMRWARTLSRFYRLGMPARKWDD